MVRIEAEFKVPHLRKNSVSNMNRLYSGCPLFGGAMAERSFGGSSLELISESSLLLVPPVGFFLFTLEALFLKFFSHFFYSPVSPIDCINCSAFVVSAMPGLSR